MNAYAPTYHQAPIANSYVYRRERAAFARWMRQVLGEAGTRLDQLTVLDVGCGTGEMLRLLKECRQGIGLDLAEGMLEEVRRLQLANVRTVHGAVEDVDFDGERFDVVVAAFTLHHLYEIRAFFDLCRRVLKPGGWFFLLEYNARAWAFSGKARRPLHLLAEPPKRVLGWKNRKRLAMQPWLPRRFNSAHRLLTFDEILAAMPDRAGYRIRRRTDGLFLYKLSSVLVEESAGDRGLAWILEIADRMAKPFDAGNFHWIAGQAPA